MKNLTKLLVSLVLCVFLCACGAEDGTEIVGEWKAQWQDATAVFYEDGTGILEYNGTIGLRWHYQPDADLYVITVESNGELYETEITTSDHLQYKISFAGGIFYRFNS